MEFEEVDLETPAGILADSLAQIFMLTTREELRQQAYQMVGAKNNRDFALAVEARLNEYFRSKQRKLDRRSILQIREEKDDAGIILEHFLKMAGLPAEAVEKFTSTNLSTQIKKLERTVNQRNFPESHAIKKTNDNALKNICFGISGYQAPSDWKRKCLGSGICGHSFDKNRDEFSNSSEDEISETFFSKKQKSVFLTRNKSAHLQDNKSMMQAGSNERNKLREMADLKPCHNTMILDEFSDFSDEFEKESLPKHDAMKSDKRILFPNEIDSEFSSYDSADFSSICDADFLRSREVITVLENIIDPGYRSSDKLFAVDDISVLNTDSVRNPLRRSKSLSK